MAKGFDRSAPMSAVRTAAAVGHPSAGAIWLRVNGELLQEGDLAQQIWKVPETIAYLSTLVELRPGDLIMTVTPKGVGPVWRGDRLEGHIDDVGGLAVTCERCSSVGDLAVAVARHRLACLRGRHLTRHGFTDFGHDELSLCMPGVGVTRGPCSPAVLVGADPVEERVGVVRARPAGVDVGPVADLLGREAAFEQHFVDLVGQHIGGVGVGVAVVDDDVVMVDERQGGGRCHLCCTSLDGVRDSPHPHIGP
jgi:hypothetical protein